MSCGWILGFMGLLGLALASIGIYRGMAYSVSQRTRELGVRLAVGARPVEVARMVMSDGLRLAGAGALLGLGGAFGATLLLRSVLYSGGGNALVLVSVP